MTIVPADFPRAASDALHKRMVESHLSMVDADAFNLFAGGLNGCLARFVLAAEADDEFRKLIADSKSLDTERGRYEQDRALFLFFVGGCAAIESAHFALFALGALAKPTLLSRSPRKQISARSSTSPVRRLSETFSPTCESRRRWRHFKQTPRSRRCF